MSGALNVVCRALWLPAQTPEGCEEVHKLKAQIKEEPQEISLKRFCHKIDRTSFALL